MIVIKRPETAEELNLYYELRYRILRKPWQQPRGSEKDELENVSVHVMAMDGGRVVGVGRLHGNPNEESQVRFMAVDPEYEGKGIGTLILKELEKEARKRHSKCIVMDARESAVDFYKKMGYRVVGPTHTLFGEIPHFRMKKDL